MERKEGKEFERTHLNSLYLSNRFKENGIVRRGVLSKEKGERKEDIMLYYLS